MRAFSLIYYTTTSVSLFFDILSAGGSQPKLNLQFLLPDAVRRVQHIVSSLRAFRGTVMVCGIENRNEVFSQKAIGDAVAVF